MRIIGIDIRNFVLVLAIASAAQARVVFAALTTWDGKHSIDNIEVTVVYFLPSDRPPLADWRERVDYFCRRIERFHEREFDGQSKLQTHVLNEPFRSQRTTEQLRSGDGDFIFFQTLGEVDAKLHFAAGERTAYPILLVLSEINWRPLDDFFRLHKKGTQLEFDGQFIGERHFPGSPSGGARATYLADRGVGWGLVSADGWRVPYCGSDCVVYHEGVGHTVGLPHPEPGNGSVMSFGQYRGWLSESWLDEAQKTRLGWSRPKKPFDRQQDLYSRFRALPDPLVPRPGEPTRLKLDWPENARPRACRVRLQTAVDGPWLQVASNTVVAATDVLPMGAFDRPTPVSYRVDAELEGGERVELWGYFQVRTQPNEPPLPSNVPAELSSPGGPPIDGSSAADEIDLLPLVRVDRDQVSGEWTSDQRGLESPKAYGARLEIPYQPPDEYRLTVIAEPLDEPNALVLGQRLGGRRFLVLLNFQTGDTQSSALENVDGKNVGANATTVRQTVFKQGQPSEIICTVLKESVEVTVDGRRIIAWRGNPAQLGLSDYWNTPHDAALFMGAYDCRYRISRVTLATLTGEGHELEK